MYHFSSPEPSSSSDNVGSSFVQGTSFEAMTQAFASRVAELRKLSMLRIEGQSAHLHG